MVIEKETAREANSIDVSSTRKHGTPGSVAFTVIINNKSDNTATKGSVSIYDADSGDGTGVLFSTIPCGRSDGKTVQIAGLPEVVIVHFESSAPDTVWNGVMNGPDIPNPVIINLT
jgi:hypothetical protein